MTYYRDIMKKGGVVCQKEEYVMRANNKYKGICWIEIIQFALNVDITRECMQGNVSYH